MVRTAREIAEQFIRNRSQKTASIEQLVRRFLERRLEKRATVEQFALQLVMRKQATAEPGATPSVFSRARSAIGNAAGAANGWLGRNVGLAVPSMREIKASPAGQVIGGVAGATARFVDDYRPRGWNPAGWFGSSQQAYALDKKIDQYNQEQWTKNPDPTSDAPVYVNRGSTFSRNGRPLKLNLKGLPGVSRAAAIDVLDAWYRDPETTRLAPPSINRAPFLVSKRNSMGIPSPFGRGNVGYVWLQPWAGISTLLHEVGHNRSYGTRPSGKVWWDGLSYVGQRPVATMRMEDLAEDNGYRLNSFMNPESRLMPEDWARRSDITLAAYTNSHDPKKQYLRTLTSPTAARRSMDYIEALGHPGVTRTSSAIDGRNRYTPIQYSGLPGQPNWYRSEYEREQSGVLEALIRDLE